LREANGGRNLGPIGRNEVGKKVGKGKVLLTKSAELALI